MSCSTPISRLFPPLAEGSSLVVAVRQADYLASALARAVEDSDAHLLNLNVGADRTDDDELLVHLRVDRRNTSAVAHSLERYGYRVVEADNIGSVDNSADPDLDATTRDRINSLIRYLEI